LLLAQKGFNRGWMIDFGGHSLLFRFRHVDYEFLLRGAYHQK
jgi:hypothetical protein